VGNTGEDNVRSHTRRRQTKVAPPTTIVIISNCIGYIIHIHMHNSTNGQILKIQKEVNGGNADGNIQLLHLLKMKWMFFLMLLPTVFGTNLLDYCIQFLGIGLNACTRLDPISNPSHTLKRKI
jgi:hypothetical protein